MIAALNHNKGYCPLICLWEQPDACCPMHTMSGSSLWAWEVWWIMTSAQSTCWI